MRDDVFDAVGIASDGEVETPIAVNAGLPEIHGLGVFLGAQRRILEITFEESKLLVERALNNCGCILQRLDGTVGDDDLHGPDGLRLAVLRVRISLRRNLPPSSPLPNGP